MGLTLLTGMGFVTEQSSPPTQPPAHLRLDNCLLKNSNDPCLLESLAVAAATTY